MFQPGKLRGLACCSTERGVFTVLALDHRQNLRRELLPADPESVSLAGLVDFKEAVVGALAPYATATLLDPEIGAGPAIAGRALPGSTGLIVAIEATGFAGSPTQRRSRILDGWSVGKAKRMGASAAKLLVYYHPDAHNADEQERLVADIQEECDAADLPLFLEPIAYSPDTGGSLVGDDRRRAVVGSARRLTSIGGDVLKAEFPYDAGVTDRARWADACAELDAASRIPWVLLSGGVDEATFLAPPIAS